MTNRRRGVVPTKKTRFSPDEYDVDYRTLTWPINQFLEEKGVIAADLIRQFDMNGKDAIYRWIKAGVSPLKFYKAAVAVYGPPTQFTERALKLDKVSRHPLRIPGHVITKLAKRFDDLYPDSFFNSSRLPELAPSVPTVTGAGNSSLTSRLPALIRALAEGKQTTTTPSRDHLGMVSLAKVASALRIERDGLLILNADYLNQLAEKDLQIQSLISERDEAMRMLDEALAPPSAPVQSVTEQVEDQYREMADIVRETDSGLLVELEKLGPKSARPA